MGKLRECHQLVILALLLLFAGSAWAEICDLKNVSRADLPQYDARVRLSPSERDAAIKTHLPWGEPACPKLLPNREYILYYSVTYRIPLWAAYELRDQHIAKGERREAFRSDPRLSADENPRYADYEEVGYDRGHLVPDADMKRSKAAQANTYFLSNMTPQTPALNRSSWLWLERMVRDYAKHYGRVYVITGSILQEPIPTLPSRCVGIPARFYKVLLRTNGGSEPIALAIALPNQEERFTVPERRRGERASDLLLEGHLVSVREIERLTGLDLLPKLERDALKRAVASELWARN
jgi:DNA/RNA endonuclease G (NUC1)